MVSSTASRPGCCASAIVAEVTSFSAASASAEVVRESWSFAICQVRELPESVSETVPSTIFSATPTGPVSSLGTR